MNMDRIYKAMNEIEELQGVSISSKELLEECIGSLTFLTMLMKIEEEFGIEIDEDDLNYETFKTLEDISKYIDQRI